MEALSARMFGAIHAKKCSGVLFPCGIASAGLTSDVSDERVQFDVHPLQRFLHPENAPASVQHQRSAVPKLPGLYQLAQRLREWCLLRLCRPYWDLPEANLQCFCC